MKKQYRVKIREDLGFDVRDEAKQLNGHIFWFYDGWLIDADGPEHYYLETAMIPCLKDGTYPIDAPTWIADGDLVPVENKVIKIDGVKGEYNSISEALKEERACSVTKGKDGGFLVAECCDGIYGVTLSKQQLIDYANELLELAES